MPRSPRYFARAALTTLAATAAGCFALFPLDDYGPGTDAGATDGRPSLGDGSVPPGSDAIAAVDPNARHVFITSAAMTGTFGGLSGADDACQKAAGSVGLTGLYKAWLSSSFQTPTNHFPDLKAEAGIPTNLHLVDLSGRPIANSWRELFEEGHPITAIAHDEHDNLVGPDSDASAGTCSANATFVWSNTLTDGGSASAGSTTNADCENYSATNGPMGGAVRVGIVSGQPNVWTDACQLPCNQSAHLYCFEQ